MPRDRSLARALFAAALLAAALATARDRVDAWIGSTVLPPLAIETGTELIARDGSLLRAWTVAGGRWRLDPGPVDPAFLALLTTYEDRRFDRHAGVDPLAMLRAVGQALVQGRVVSGGSTLTMQVARLIEGSGTGRLAGKLRQIRVALALERRLTKDQILDLYLRLAPYGGNIEGIRAASLAWFGHAPRRLTPAEAALLVALPQAPEARRPDRDAQAARAGRDRVLARAEAAGLIDAAGAAAARAEPVPQRRRDPPQLAPQLADRLRAENPGMGVIRSTIDAGLQRSLQDLAARAVVNAGQRLSVAMVVVDHRSGEILASVGGADWGDGVRGGWLDLTQALRSPGSTLKPFVYGLAFDAGLAHPETLVEDRPMRFGSYAPQNFDRQFRGTLPAREALQLSLNLPVVALAEAVGPARLVATLEAAGAAPRLAGAPGLAVALGGLGISLQDLAGAYAGLARLGAPVRISALAGTASPLPGRLMRPEAAWQVGEVLAGLTPPGGGQAGRIAWKTGTSYGHRDALAVGFDGAHVVAVWMGRADGTAVPGAFGGDLAAPLMVEAFGRLGTVARPAPPPGTLILPNDRLPLPLRHFAPRGEASDAPKLAFPPSGAEVAVPRGQLVAKVRDGTPPFTWLANGRPVLAASPEREVVLPAEGPGFLSLSVIDAAGRASGVELRLR
ncbi:penicillin-binding protein 1C [Frigidibacter sp. MR17.14]|uniref:penicillin-binding protein 1C n=1 Tax=Frigidibacter sp. MR17.14 TaxID=3126509 RepID=UPI0030130E80